MIDLSETILGLIYAASLLGAIGAIVFRKVLAADRSHPPSLPAGKVQAWFYQRGDLVAALVLYLLFTGLFALAAISPPMDISKMSAAALLFGIGFQLAITAGVIGYVLRLTSINQWLGLRWKEWPWVFAIAPGVVILVWAFTFGIDQFGYTAWMESLGAELEQEPVALLKNTKDPMVLGLMAITAVIVAPLWEEVVFRGYLHPVMKKFGGVWAGAICSSLLFAVVHNSLAHVLPLFLLALLLVWLYERTGSIWTPIAIHACFNGAQIGLLFAFRAGWIPEELPEAMILWP